MGISKRNPSGCYDPTAYEALNNILQKEKREKEAFKQALIEKCWVCHYRSRCNQAFKRKTPCNRWRKREW